MSHRQPAHREQEHPTDPHQPIGPSEPRRDGQSAFPLSVDQPTFDPLGDIDGVGYEPYPSPALSAYSYTTSSSVDLSDFESDLGSLSLDAIDEPARHHQPHLAERQSNLLHVSTDLQRSPEESEGLQEQQHGTPQGKGSPHSYPRRRDVSGDLYISGTSTPIAGASSFCLTGSRSGFTEASPDLHLRSQSPSHTGQAAALSPTTRDPSTQELTEQTADEEEDQIELESEGEGFDFEDEDEDDMHAEGIPAARGWRLDARQANTMKFRQKVLDLFASELELMGWAPATADPALLPLKAENIQLKRISGAFTNAVFFASYEVNQSTPSSSVALPPTVLLRVYGTGSEALLSRRAELLILHTLSSLYEIGPHILGTFANGRVEEFYECEPIQKEGIRDLGDREAKMVAGGSLKVKGQEGRAHWVARRMNELHAVPLEVMKTVLEQGDLKAPGEKGFGRGIQDHIMASSHRPRRRLRNKPSHPSALAAASLGTPASPYILSLDGRQSVRASPVPLRPNELPLGFEADGSHTQPAFARNDSTDYYAHRNSSIASLDSLATSYDSQSSFASYSPSLHALGSPQVGPAQGTAASGASSYFPWSTTAANSPKATMSPFALGPQRGRRSSTSARGPYPGVWRRIKRWSREAAKVVQLVESFAKCESGSKAVALAFVGHPSIKEEMEGGLSGERGLSTETIGATPGSLRNTLRCMRAIDLASLVKELDEFKHFVRKWERRHGPSKRVFAHNDTQYGNLLEIKSAASGGGGGGAAVVTSSSADVGTPDGRAHSTSEGPIESPAIPTGMPRYGSLERQRASMDSGIVMSPSLRPVQTSSKPRSRKPPPPHHKLVVIDFEYACPNPRGYDIANHFQEWRTDYHHPTMSWSLRCHGAYPDAHERRKWLRAYVEQGRLVRMRGRAIGLDSLPAPTDMVLPPSVVTMPTSGPSGSAPGSTSSLASNDSGYVAAMSKQESRASQFGALEKSLGGSGKPPGPGAQTPSVHSLRSGTTVNTPSVEGEVSEALEGKAAQDLLSPSSWQQGGISAPSINLPGSDVLSGGGSSGGIGSDAPMSPQSLALVRLDASIEKEVDRLEREIQVWSPATHAVWGLWGIVFAKEELESVLARAIEEVEVPASSGDSVLQTHNGEAKQVAAGSAESFDNLRYALGRVELFREEFGRLKSVGLDAI